MTWLNVAAVVVVGGLVFGLWRRVRVLEMASTRIDRMAEAVSLLSETAEAGLAAVSAEIERLQRTEVTQPAASRTTVSRRVVRAATHGESVDQIARHEALSEGEIRLHLALAGTTAPKKGGRRAAVRA